ncbi:integral membrane protein [Fusarium flagelliforme]|uniref:Integral membrane protein n=1 Tax=Fusarium flagelliforme TaxID=2675880 RepID=A0A395M4T4_9HYPO|nr:integral membrane protein [Fusarium flagelliforme]
MWSLPKSALPGSYQSALCAMRHKIDWVGTLLVSAFMALLSYFLSIIGTDIYRIKEAGSIVLLCLCLILVPLFVAWMRFQVKRDKPALIPNGFWRNTAFASICGTIALSFAALNSMDLMTSLYFQQIQQLSGLDAAIQIIPSAVVGLVLNVTTGYIVNRVPAIWLVTATTLLSSGSPLLMAIINPHWSYWKGAFFAQILLPFSFDILFTVGHLIITEAFPNESQSRAGAVFYTSAQFGNAVGLAITQTASTLFAKKYNYLGHSEALLHGLRAGFWAIFIEALALECPGRH